MASLEVWYSNATFGVNAFSLIESCCVTITFSGLLGEYTRARSNCSPSLTVLRSCP